MAHDPEVQEHPVIVHSLDSHGKWVVGVVSAALVGAVALFATSERSNFQERLKAQEEAIKNLAVHEYRLNEQQTDLRRIESKLDLILDRMPMKAK